MKEKDFKYKVVIECATYNQRDYIEDALNGFVMQKTDFPFCALIIDDCSTDGQQEIIKRYAEKYPDIIIPIFLPFNHYQAKKSKQEYFEPFFRQSKYIAKCEGDDYWIDDHKLQKQADFLDANPECALTYHACINKFEEEFNGVMIHFGENVKEQYNYIELLKHYSFQTATIMMRSSVWFNPFFQRCYSIYSPDYIQYFAASQIGTVKGINQKWSVYRRSCSGISIGVHRGNELEKKFHSWQLIADQCAPEVRDNIHKISIAATLYELYKVSFKDLRSACIEEYKKYPAVVHSVLKRVFRSTVKRMLKFNHI